MTRRAIPCLTQLSGPNTLFRSNDLEIRLLHDYSPVKQMFFSVGQFIWTSVTAFTQIDHDTFSIISEVHGPLCVTTYLIKLCRLLPTFFVYNAQLGCMSFF